MEHMFCYSAVIVPWPSYIFFLNAGMNFMHKVCILFQFCLLGRGGSSILGSLLLVFLIQFFFLTLLEEIVYIYCYFDNVWNLSFCLFFFLPLSNILKKNLSSHSST